MPRATCRPIKTRFRFGFGSSALTLLHTTTPRIILQKARCHTCVATVVLQLLVGTRLQGLLFPSRGASHLSLTVLVHYRSLGVFSLRQWSAQIHAEFHGFRVTREHFKPGRLVSSTGLSPSMDHLSREIRLPSGMVTGRLVLHPIKKCPTTPLTHRCKAVACKRFRLIPFRSPLLRESHSLSSPPLT